MEIRRSGSSISRWVVYEQWGCDGRCLSRGGLNQASGHLKTSHCEECSIQILFQCQRWKEVYTANYLTIAFIDTIRTLHER